MLLFQNCLETRQVLLFFDFSHFPLRKTLYISSKGIWLCRQIFPLSLSLKVLFRYCAMYDVPRITELYLLRGQDYIQYLQQELSIPPDPLRDGPVLLALLGEDPLDAESL